MRRTALAFFALSLTVLLTGCAGLSLMPHSTGTVTKLTEKNYQVVKTNVRGESHGFGLLLGFIPIIPVSHAEAMAVLHRSAGMNGKATALVNVTQDWSQINLVLFTIPRLTISADVVEFVE
jgi:hypothetical protein